MPRPKNNNLTPVQAQAKPSHSLPLLSVKMPPEMSSMHSFVDDHDAWYFGLFRDQVVHELSPYHGVRFWNQVLYRDSTVHQCIRHCVL
ncbi:hypothetical protein Micbo1qcDRAFT_160252, partial [Microdochium bolleyi]